MTYRDDFQWQMRYLPNIKRKGFCHSRVRGKTLENRDGTTFRVYRLSEFRPSILVATSEPGLEFIGRKKAPVAAGA